MSVFKENDIRGLYPEEWNAETVGKIARALPQIFKGKKIIIGRDGRDSSVEISNILIQELVGAGMEVINIGVVDTPAVYFVVGHYSMDGGIMITASHNPPGYNGIKLTGKNCIPIEYTTGIQKLESLVDEMKDSDSSNKKNNGKYRDEDISENYLKFLDGFRPKFKTPPVAVDFSNGSGGMFGMYIASKFLSDVKLLNCEIDGSFPNHGPNPSQKENLLQLKSILTTEKRDIGFCFDGDGDRVVMVDEGGEIISPDLITALIGLYYFKCFPEKRKENNLVLVDVRSSKSVIEFLQSLGANTEYCPVGHAKIKKQLREKNALYAGELTGHYYFRDNYYSDSPWITIFLILQVIEKEKKSISELKAEVMKYYFSGELNFPYSSNFDLIMNDIQKKYSDAEISDLDGLRFDYKDWWFILRKSGTEPLVRLVAEAQNENLLKTRVEEVSEILRGEWVPG